MLRIFLAASSRGEEAVFTLETRGHILTTKYICVETVVVVPATTSSTSNTRRQFNPARARMSILRLERFNMKIEKRRKKPKPFSKKLETRILLSIQLEKLTTS